MATAGETLPVPIDVGRGDPVVLLPGYAMRPELYLATAELLARSSRVVVTDLYGVRGRWSYDRVLAAFTATLGRMGLDVITLVGHSFGGGIELGFAASYPDRVAHAVFGDTLAVSREWPLAEESWSHPLRLLWMATPRAAISFLSSWVTHPRQLAEAAWWGFTSARDDEIAAVAGAGVPCHVVWANRDSLLSVDDGREFAQDLHASFTVVRSRGREPVDHDWMYRHPHLFVEHLRDLGVVP